jgi:hypothetical protein
MALTDALTPILDHLPHRRAARARGLAATTAFPGRSTPSNVPPSSARLRRAALSVALLSGTLLAAAAPAQAAPQWLSPQTLSPPGYDASEQQVAFDPGGDAVVVWQQNGPSSNVILASARPAGGSFSAPQTLSETAKNASAPDVASDAQGDAVAVWLQWDGSEERVQAAYRPAGGSFGAAQTLSEAGVEAETPRVTMNGSGEAVAVWNISVGGKMQIQSAAAAPGGVFGAPADLTGLTVNASVPQVALDSHGDAIAVWDGWDGANIRIEDALRPAGESFGAPQYLSPAGYNADVPQLAFDASGDALAVWSFDGSPSSTVQSAYLPAGGTFSSPQTVPAPNGEPAQVPQVAFDGSGEGVVAWLQSDGSEPRVYASVRSAGAGGTFSTPGTLDPSGQEAYGPRVAGDGLSAVIVSWKTFNGATSYTQAVERPAGGNFSAATDVSTEGPEESAPEVGVDAQGNGIAVFSRAGSGGEYLIEAAGYDAEGPQLRGLTIPSAGIVGQPLQFFQAPLDVWSGVLSEGFSFGDGSGASGVSTTHTYMAPGTYRVTASAIDALGNTTTVTRTVTILAPTTSAGTTAPVALKPSTKTKGKGKHKRRRKHGKRHHHRRHSASKGRAHGILRR